jgi:hypothetical protein
MHDKDLDSLRTPGADITRGFQVPLEAPENRPPDSGAVRVVTVIDPAEQRPGQRVPDRTARERNARWRREILRKAARGGVRSCRGAMACPWVSIFGGDCRCKRYEDCKPAPCSCEKRLLDAAERAATKILGPGAGALAASLHVRLTRQALLGEDGPAEAELRLRLAALFEKARSSALTAEVARERVAVEARRVALMERAESEAARDREDGPLARLFGRAVKSDTHPPSEPPDPAISPPSAVHPPSKTRDVAPGSTPAPSPDPKYPPEPARPINDPGATHPSPQRLKCPSAAT